MIEPAIMQAISKSVDYSRNKTELKLFETSIKDIIRKIKGQSGDTLDTVARGDSISDSLLADIKDKQDDYLINFNDYLTEIDDYADTDPRADLSPYQSYTYNFSAITAGIILADENIIYQILSEIMNNEGFYYERRVSIRSMLWYIRNIIVDTGIFGQLEANMDNITDFTNDYTEENITLEAIYDVMEGGEEALQLKQYTITVTAGNTTTQALASDEILYSIDKYDIYAGTSGGITLNYTNDSTDSVLTQASGGTTIDGAFLPIEESESTANGLPTLGLGGTLELDASGSTAGTGTVKFTVRKVAVYS